jgi:hypothetical protein
MCWRQGTGMTMRYLLPLAALALPFHAHAQTHPYPLGDGFTLSPMVDARLRWEAVEAGPRDAHAETLRIRSGAELAHGPLSLLAEGTGTIPFGSSFSAFSHVAPSGQYRPHRATIADGASLGLNRLQLRYASKPLTLTLGRQRIAIDDQRFVGNAPWRQHEQTFDAARLQLSHGALVLDATRANRQNTVNGSDAAPRDTLTGRFTFLSGGLVVPEASLKGFGYLIDYDPLPFLNQPSGRAQFDSSQTWGLRATGLIHPAGAKLAINASLARQNAFGRNPNPYRATYASVEGALTVKGHTAILSHEVLGADAQAHWSLQTPLSSLHKFNGWADVFLTTPAAGLRDTTLGLSGKVPLVKGLTYATAHHWFDADIGATRYGKEIDASLGFATGRIAWLGKLAKYEARGFGTDVLKLWVQAEFVF